MHRYAFYAVVAVVVVAVLSAVVHEAKARRVDEYDATECADGTLTVTPEEDEVAEREERIPYANLSAGMRAAFDRARSNGGSTDIDPEVLSGTPFVQRLSNDIVFEARAFVTVDDRVYSVDPKASNCPTIPGTPVWLNCVVDPLSLIYRAFSPLYLPVAGLLAVVAGYRKVDEWLRFG